MNICRRRNCNSEPGAYTYDDLVVKPRCDDDSKVNDDIFEQLKTIVYIERPAFVVIQKGLILHISPYRELAQKVHATCGISNLYYLT